MMVDPVIGRETIRARIAGLGAGIEEITLDVHHIGMIDGLVYHSDRLLREKVGLGKAA